MNVTLSNPALLPLAALITVPVVIHLFARARPRSIPFSSIRFLEEILRKTARIQKPRSWLILLLRTLVFAALLGVFLKPVLMGPNPLAGSGDRKNVIILLDASASMAAVEGSHTRFAAACIRASEILDGLRPGDLANLVWVRGRSTSEFPNLAVNHGALQKALHAAQASQETADLPGAFARAEALLRGTKGVREVHVISDFQASNWKGFSVPELSETRLVLIEAGARESSNQALLEILPSASKALVGEDVELTARVANFSAQPVLRRVFLRGGEITQSQDLRLLPWSEGSVTFSCRFPKPGEQALEFTIDEDDFPFDNVRQVILDVQAHLAVGVAGPDAETARLWTRALECVDWIQVFPVDWESVPPVDVLLCAGWGGEHRDILEKFLAGGGCLVCSPASGLPVATLLGLAGRQTAEPDARFQTTSLRRPTGLQIANPKHPAFAIFSGGESGNPAGGKFSERLEVSSGGVPEDGVVLQFSDGVPAVAEWGRVILWNLPLGKSEPAWAERTEFVPFLAELVLSSRNEQGTTGIGEFPSGSKISRELPGDTLDDEVSIRGPSGEVPVERVGSQIFRSRPPLGPGLYEWIVHGTGIGFSVVNFPSVESDLRALPAPPTAGPETVRLAVGERVSSLRSGVPLWPWLLGLACFCVVGESLVVWKTRPAVT